MPMRRGFKFVSANARPALDCASVRFARTSMFTSTLRQSAASWLNEDVSLLAVLAHIEALNLVLLTDPQAHHGVEHLEDDEGGDDGDDPGDGHGCDLTGDDASPFDQTERL